MKNVLDFYSINTTKMSNTFSVVILKFAFPDKLLQNSIALLINFNISSDLFSNKTIIAMTLLGKKELANIQIFLMFTANFLSCLDDIFLSVV